MLSTPVKASEKGTVGARSNPTTKNILKKKTVAGLSVRGKSRISLLKKRRTVNRWISLKRRWLHCHRKIQR